MYNKKLVIPTVCELLRSLPTIRSDWNLKSPLQKWCYFYGAGRAACILTAIPAFEDDQTLSLWAYQFFVYLGIYVMLAAYTVYNYTISGEFTKCLPCTCLLGLILASLPYYFVAISKQRNAIHRGLEYRGRYIYRTDFKDIEYNKICSKHMDFSVKSFLIRMIIISLSLVIVTSGPVYAYFLNGIKTTALEVRVPYTDENSNEEFLWNLIVHMSIFMYGSLAFVGMEIAMELFMGTITIAPKLIAHEFRKMDEKIKKFFFTKLQFRLTFRNIVQQIMDADDFMIAVVDLVYYRDLLAPGLFMYSIGMSIFCQFALDYISGYGIALMCYVQLFFICYAGEHFQDNGMGDVIYNSNWYAMPIEHQKIIMHLINRKQNGVSLTVGPFSTINHEYCYMITNKIYSFVMFLINFFE